MKYTDKTVRDLIEFLKTLDPEKGILVSYDGYRSNLQVTQSEDNYYFSNQDYIPSENEQDYLYPEVLFFAKLER